MGVGKDYEKFVKETDKSDQNPIFYIYGMSEEHGEAMGIFKRVYRGDYGDKIRDEFRKDNDILKLFAKHPKVLMDFKKELGDYHWYKTRLLQCLGSSWKEIEAINMHKLEKRVRQKNIIGSGSDRENKK